MLYKEISHRDIDLLVEYEIEAGEPATRDYPGCTENIEIRSIKYKGVDVYDIYYENNLLPMIEEKLEDKKPTSYNFLDTINRMHKICAPVL